MKMILKSGSTSQASGIRVDGICTWSWPPSSSSTISSNAIANNSFNRPYNNTMMSRQGISTEVAKAGRSNAINKLNKMIGADLSSGRKRRLIKQERRKKKKEKLEKRLSNSISLI